MTDISAKKLTSAAYITLIGFNLLSMISGILHAYNIMPLIPARIIEGWDTHISPVHIFITFLYLCYCCALFICGPKMKLRGISYAGIAIMTLLCIYYIFIAIYPIYTFVYNEVGYSSGATLVSIMTFGTQLLKIIGTLLFLLGTCTSTALKILTPVCMLLALLVSIAIFPLADCFGWEYDYPLHHTISAIFNITMTCAMLLPPYIAWNKKQ